MAKIPEQMPAKTRQLEIVHLSDIHFGLRHRFNPPKTVDGDEPEDKSFPSLLDKLTQDLTRPDPNCPVAVCITGDIVETGSVEEYKEAEQFIEGLINAPILGRCRDKTCLFIVPGNHDVKFDSDDIGIRWQQWTEFYNRFYGTNIRREEPHGLVQLYDRTEDLGAIFLCLNSAIHVQKGRPDEDRGRLDVKQLTFIEESLEALDASKLQDAIRVAIVHHHPVLIPALSEPGRGYDAIHNSGKLLTILRKYGFHLVLHGHKHNPNTFTDDTKSAHQDLPDQPIFVAAGGSAGSCGLPPFPKCANCYNHIKIKWHPVGNQMRIRAETRSLSIFNRDGTERLPTRWTWETMTVDDRHFSSVDHTPTPGRSKERSYDPKVDDEWDKLRIELYVQTRGNLPTVQILPSLIPGQAYEAVLWIVPHPYGVPKSKNDIPKEVTWSAGKRFEVVTVQREDDPNYTARQTYWGPMLVQAKMTFPDGYVAVTHVYARMPSVYHAEKL